MATDSCAYSMNIDLSFEKVLPATKAMTLLLHTHVHIT